MTQQLRPAFRVPSSMSLGDPYRRIRSRVGLLPASTAILVCVTLLGRASMAQVHPAPFVPQRTQQQFPSHPNPQGRPAGQPHLAQWMENHRFLTPSQQQTALTNEPGFRDLPAQTQQRMLDRLTQLNNMPLEQRNRVLARNEAIEQLTPPQRQQIRSAMQQLGAIQIDRRRVIARTFRELRTLPPDQRLNALNSERYRGQFTDDERGTLTNLLAVEPYLPERSNE